MDLLGCRFAWFSRFSYILITSIVVCFNERSRCWLFISVKLFIKTCDFLVEFWKRKSSITNTTILEFKIAHTSMQFNSGIFLLILKKWVWFGEHVYNFSKWHRLDVRAISAQEVIFRLQKKWNLWVIEKCCLYFYAV